MIKQKATVKILTITTALTILAGAASAERPREMPYAAELDACVTALKASIEMDGVHRIRHVVTKLTPDSIGYRITLQTSTYSGDTVRQYSASCFANGDNPPLKLRVREKTS